MASQSKMLTPEEFVSLLTVRNTRVNDSAPAIPAEHSVKWTPEIGPNVKV